MNTLLQNLFNDGSNDGNFIINTNIKCHSFILYHLSTTCKNLIDDNIYEIELNVDEKIIRILINYFYTEKFLSIDLTAIQIVDLFTIINTLKCNNIIPLKKHYISKFLLKLDEDNYIYILKLVNNIHIDLEEIILTFFSQVILNNELALNSLSNNPLSNISDNILNKLFNISIQNINIYNKEINDLKNERDTILNNILLEKSIKNKSQCILDDEYIPKTKKSKN